MSTEIQLVIRNQLLTLPALEVENIEKTLKEYGLI